jgi:hypothetical protein
MKLLKWMLMGALCAAPLMAQVKIPRGMVEPKDIESARKEAQQKREALIYIMANTTSTQGFVQEALDDYFKRFRTYGPVVIVRAGVTTTHVPEDVMKALDGLKGYPRLVATDPDDNRVIASVPYLTLDARDEGLRDHRRVLHKYLSDKKRQPRVPPTPVPSPTPVPPPPTPTPAPDADPEG